jgi:4-hydroxythreonine-4-phosphate dehydrogenase
MSSKTHSPIVGITLGDPNGIGAELIMKIFSDTRMLEICTPIIYGSAKILLFYKKLLGANDFNFNQIDSADKILHKKVNLVNINAGDFKVTPGISSNEGGKASFNYLKTCTEDIASNKIDVMVTCPINKKNIQSEDFNFPGHTEYLANYANEDNPLMIMATDDTRVGLVSIHVPIKDVANQITTEAVASKANAFIKSLIQDFGISKPKLAVLGLNPHAGDNGLLGDEEINIISPAIEKLKNDGNLVFGPFSADGFFGSSNFQKYDGILAMYHDQGLTPFKALTFDEGINFTAGLPIVRTSPDHGVGYDIAGKNEASETSLRNAIYTACDIYRTRKNYKELLSNQLKNNESKHKRD